MGRPKQIDGENVMRHKGEGFFCRTSQSRQKGKKDLSPSEGKGGTVDITQVQTAKLVVPGGRCDRIPAETGNRLLRNVFRYPYGTSGPAGRTKSVPKTAPVRAVGRKRLKKRGGSVDIANAQENTIDA